MTETLTIYQNDENKQTNTENTLEAKDSIVKSKKNSFLPMVKSVVNKFGILRTKKREKYLFGPKSEALLVDCGYLAPDWKEKLRELEQAEKKKRRQRFFSVQMYALD